MNSQVFNEDEMEALMLESAKGYDLVLKEFHEIRNRLQDTAMALDGQISETAGKVILKDMDRRVLRTMIDVGLRRASDTLSDLERTIYQMGYERSVETRKAYRESHPRE